MSNLGPWALFTAGVVGLVTAASVLIIDYIRQERRRMILAQDFSKLSEELSSMRAELDSLRSLQINQRKVNGVNGNVRRRRVKNNESVSTQGTESDAYFSSVGTDVDSDEFFDLSSVESDDEERDSIDGDGISKDLHDLDKLLDGNETDIRLSLTRLQELFKSHPDHTGVYWRFAKACYRLSECIQDVAEKRQLIDEGLEYCQSSLDKDNCTYAHKWYAILVGSRATIQSSIKEKINDGHKFKLHLDEALKNSPNDWVLHHLLGRFKFEIAGMSWLERTAASALFAEPPSGTFEEAISSLCKAEELSPKLWKENRLFLAKCYLAVSDTDQAVEWLQKAKDINSTSSFDKKLDSEISTLLVKYTA